MARSFKGIWSAVLDDIYVAETDAALPVVKRYVNRAYHELAKRSRIEKKVPVTAVDNKFAKPSDYVRGFELYYGETPITFTEQEGYILSEYSGELTFVYNYSPTDMSADADVPVTHESNDDFIIEWTKYLWFNRENKKEYKAEIHRGNAEMINLVYPKKDINWTVERGN